MTRKHSGGSYHVSQTSSITLRSECWNLHGEAEDAVQDGLLAATRKLKTFEGRARFSTWLTRADTSCAPDNEKHGRG